VLGRNDQTPKTKHSSDRQELKGESVVSDESAKGDMIRPREKLLPVLFEKNFELILVELSQSEVNIHGAEVNIHPLKRTVSRSLNSPFSSGIDAGDF
jgi:hypothetical protein